MGHIYTQNDEDRLQHLQREHWEIAHYKPGLFALRNLFSSPELDIMDYCKDFRVNPHAQPSEAEVKTFAQHHGVWVKKGGDHYNNMTAYLHPTPDYERLTLIGKAYAVLFYMNDTIGREKMGHMTAEQIAEVRGIVGRLEVWLKTGALPPGAGPIERSAYVSSEEIRALADPAWYQAFLVHMKQHFEPSFFDRNARAQGEVMTVHEYIDCRLNVSGMFATIALMEFGDGEYIEWQEVRAFGFYNELKRLQWLCAAIGALMNDLFSFEKEFIVEGSDFNLIPVMTLNNPHWSLEQVVTHAAELVRCYVIEFRDLAEQIEAVCGEQADAHPALVSAIRKHILSLVGSVQATWVWENDTARYKQAQTIFLENQHSA